MQKRRFHILHRFPAEDPGLYTPILMPASMRQALDNVAHACMESRSAMVRKAIAEMLERIYKARSSEGTVKNSCDDVDTRQAA